MTRKTLIFSSLTGGKLTGHMILDDVFWIKYFKSQGIEADIITSAYSKANLQKLFPSHQGAINTFEGQPDDDFAGRSKLIRKVFASPRVRNSLVVIQGFEELSILVFLIKNLGGNNQYVLVPTNNIAKGRITGKGRLPDNRRLRGHWTYLGRQPGSQSRRTHRAFGSHAFARARELGGPQAAARVSR